MTASIWKTAKSRELSIASFGICLALTVANAGKVDAQAPDCQSCQMAERIQQATELKSGFEDFISQAKEFHKSANRRVLEAQRLEGEAQKLASEADSQSLKGSLKTQVLQGQANSETLQGSAQFQQGMSGALHPQKANLSATQLKSAVQQYSSDLSKFVAHAEQYNLHATQFDQQLGRCKANEDLYKANLTKYELHLAQFHLPNISLPSQALAAGVIRPPHICPAMLASKGEASSMANQYYNDQVRVLSAEQQLAHAETDLLAARQKAGLSNAELEKEIVRGQRESTLALEFGRLKDEYDMLVTEKDRIALSSKGAGKIEKPSSSAQTDVHAKVQTK